MQTPGCDVGEVGAYRAILVAAHLCVHTRENISRSPGTSLKHCIGSDGDDALH